MKNESNLVKNYCADVSKALICERKKKNEILSELKTSVEEYFSEHPTATPDELREVFGSPSEIAASALQGEDLNALKRKTLIRRDVIIAVILALLIWAAFAVASLIDVHEEAHGYMEEGIMAISTIESEVLK